MRDHAAVAAGDVLVRLDPEPYRLALAKADAEIDSARAAVEQLKVSLRETRADAKEAENRLSYLELQAKRQRELSGRGVSSAARSSRPTARSCRRATASACCSSASRGWKRHSAATRTSRPTATPPCARRRRCATAPRSISPTPRSRRRAPASCVNFRLQLGEQVKAQTPLFSLVADRRPWVEANFKETDLTYVTVGQKATVVLDMHPDITWEAEVESISPATGAEFAILPPQNASGNWVKVVQRLPVQAAPDRAAGRAAAARRHDGICEHRHETLAQPRQDFRQRRRGGGKALTTAARSPLPRAPCSSAPTHPP